MASEESLKIQLYDNLGSLEGIRADWDALLAEFPHATTFSTWEWLAPWWRAFGESDRLHVLAFRDAASALVGLAPLALTTLSVFPTRLRLLRMMGDGSHDSDNLDLPVRSGREAEFSSALLDWLEQHARDWDICGLHTLPAHSPVGLRLLNDLKLRNWRAFTSTHPHTVVELPENWETYTKALSSKERGKIGLRSRRLEKKYKVQIRKCTDEAELDSLLAALFELHGQHWQLRGLPGTLRSPARRQFYGELARLLLARRRLEFWALELDGRIVALQFGFRHGSTVFSLQEGFDPEDASDSVGYVLRSQVLKQLIADGVRCYDFLGGTDESKLRWGAQVKSYLNIDFARPLTRGTLHLSLQYKSAETKAWLRTNLPQPLLRVLKRGRGILPEG